MIGKYNKSVLLTYCGVCLALLGGYFALAGTPRNAFLCLIYAGICDLLDGPIARRCQRDESEKAFGVQIDSLADVVSFLALPAVLAGTLLGRAAMVAVPYVLAGIIRLAWFNLQADGEAPVRCYEGLPVTYAALVLPVYAALWQHFPQIFSWQGFAALYLILAAAFVVRAPIPKPRGIWYVVFGVLAVLVTAALLLGA